MSPDIQLRRLLLSFRDANLRCQNCALKFSVEMPIERSSQKSASAFEFTCFSSVVACAVSNEFQTALLVWLDHKLAFGSCIQSRLIRIFSLRWVLKKKRTEKPNQHISCRSFENKSRVRRQARPPHLFVPTRPKSQAHRHPFKAPWV